MWHHSTVSMLVFAFNSQENASAYIIATKSKGCATHVVFKNNKLFQLYIKKDDNKGRKMRQFCNFIFDFISFLLFFLKKYACKGKRPLQAVQQAK